MKSFIIFILMSFIYSCSFNLPIVKKAQQTSTIIKSYDIEKPFSSNIGEPFITAQRGLITPTYKVLFDYQPPRINLFLTKQPMLFKDQEFKVLGYTKTEKGEGVLVTNEEYTKEIWKNHGSNSTLEYSISITPDGFIQYGWRPYHGAILSEQGVWTDKKLFEMNPKSFIVSPESFKFEIIYLGLNGNTVRAKYREYSSNLARDAFSQDLTWNLDESKIITYRTIKAEVIKATNSNLEIKVLEDGGLEWLP